MKLKSSPHCMTETHPHGWAAAGARHGLGQESALLFGLSGAAEGAGHHSLWTQLLQKLYCGMLGPGGAERKVQLSSVQRGVQSEACAEEEQHAGSGNG